MLHKRKGVDIWRYAKSILFTFINVSKFIYQGMLENNKESRKLLENMEEIQGVLVKKMESHI